MAAEAENYIFTLIDIFAEREKSANAIYENVRGIVLENLGLDVPLAAVQEDFILFCVLAMLDPKLSEHIRRTFTSIVKQECHLYSYKEQVLVEADKFLTSREPIEKNRSIIYLYTFQ